MMKIKIRAWDTETKEYIHEINFNDYEISDDCGEIYVTKHIDQSGETPLLELELFTGMLDKSGKEIYDGDIIASGATLFIVKWDDHSAMFKCYFTKTDEHYCNLNDKYMESFSVVGNIHENKNLLQGGK